MSLKRNGLHLLASPDHSDSELDSDSSSEDVTEDEHGDELTPALDAAILRTLGRIKRGEGVYGSENVLGEALKEAESRAGTLRLNSRGRGQKAEKPFLLADHHRANLLANRIADEDDEPQYVEPLTNVQSERLLRAEAVSAFNDLTTADDEDDGVFEPKKREKDEEEVVADDEEYRRFLLEMGGGEAEVRRVLGMGDQPVADLAPLSDKDDADAQADEEEEYSHRVADRSRRKASKAKADDDFLMNYILNRGWIDRTDQHVPTYDEVVGEVHEMEEVVPEENEAGPSHPWGVLDEDEFDDKADDFEAAYNFRFEEPGSTTISTHPRTIPTLVRRPDDVRKAKRAARAERKAAEKAAQEEETRRLKGKKRREAEQMLAGLRKELGDKVDWEEMEKVLEGEWDEAEWERIVGGMLSQRREDESDDEMKPTWDDELGDEGLDGDERDEDDDLTEATGMKADEEDYLDGPVNMDADHLEDLSGRKSKKDRKRKRHVDEEDETAGADLTVEDKAVRMKQAMNEYKALDHEDVIGDLPTRFKYTNSVPTNFGLSPVEILLATDAELNAIAPVKTLAPYRRGYGMAGKGMGKRVRDLRDELRKRRWGEVAAPPKWKSNGATGSNDVPMGRRGEGEERKERKGKRLGRKERLKMKVVEGVDGEDDRQSKPRSAFDRVGHVMEHDGDTAKIPGEGHEGSEREGKKRRKKKKSGHAGQGGLQIFD